MSDRTCAGCGIQIAPGRRERNRRKWCSESCRVRQYRPKSLVPPERPCSWCGALFKPYSTVHHVCSRQCGKKWTDRRPDEAHTCQQCGVGFTRPPTKGQRPKWCSRCRRDRRRQAAIPKATREAVFDRDGWICQLCMEPVDRSAKYPDLWSATLDHIVCQSWTVDPDHSIDNLRLAHHWCNSTRCDGRTYSDEDFQPITL